MPSAIDPTTLLAILSRIEHRLAELSRRTGHCALCKSAELRAVAAELRGLAREPAPRASPSTSRSRAQGT